MAEQYPSDADLNALSGTTDAEQEVLFVATGESPYYTSFYKMLYRLLDVARRAGDLRVYKDGDLTFGVRTGRYLDGDTVRDYAGATTQSLTNNATNYIYLTAAGTLTVNTTGFPTPSATPHVSLATILTASGDYDCLTDITDYRGRAIFTIAAGLSPALGAEAAAFFGATDISGAEAETLTDLSNADSLHKHDTAGLEDGAVTNAKIASNAAIARSKLAEEELARYQVSLMADCRNANGSVLVTSNPAVAGKFSIKDSDGGSCGWSDGTLILEGGDSDEGNITSTLCFEFTLPPEYVAGHDVKLNISARCYESGIAASTKTIDAQVYELTDAGGHGGDLCTTGIQNITNSYVDYAFEITDAGFAPGDRLMVYVQTFVSSTMTTCNAEIGSIEMQLDIKG